MEFEEVLELRRTQYENFLHSLIEALPARFDAELPKKLPKTHGLYAISMINSHGEYLHAGKTIRGRNGLLGRIWEQHYQIGGAIRSPD